MPAPRYGQAEGPETTALVPPSAAMSPLLWFAIAVGAGVTVWAITRYFERGERRPARRPKLVHVEEEEED